MDAELKTKWVKALRSGEFKQGEGFLERDGRMCCLGVCLALQGEQIAQWPIQQKRTSILPEEFRRGLERDQMEGLASRNDGINGFRKHTFFEIADYIEKNL